MPKRIDNETLAAIVKDLKEYLGEGADIKTSDATEDNVDVHLLTLFFRSGKEYLCIDICKEQHVDVYIHVVRKQYTEVKHCMTLV